FVDAVRGRVTNAETWEAAGGKPKLAVSIGFSFNGLLALEVPTRSLGGMPDEFIVGMKRRAHILGDIQDSAPETWDPIWQSAPKVHIWIALEAQANADGTPDAELEKMMHWLRTLIEKSRGGVGLLAGHGPTNAD